MIFTIQQLQKYKESYCPFCDRDKQFNIIETNNFYLTFDRFPLYNKHLMISSKEHFGCMGEVYQEFDDELQDLLDKTKRIFNREELTIYEHGRAGSCMILPNGKSCHHFHLHFVPIKTDFYNILSESYKYKILQNYNDIYNYCSKYGDYILYQSGDKIAFFYTEDRAVPSHLMRTLIANHIKIPARADWELYDSANLFNQKYQEMVNLKKLILE